MAAALLAGTVLRSGSARELSVFGTHVGGLRTLSETERLVLFEDYATGPGGWSTGQRNDAHLGLGSLWLAAPADVALSREIALPEGTVRAVLSLDLIAIDDWALEGLAITLNGAEILRHRFTSRPDLVRQGPPPPLRTDRLALRSALDDPREQGFAAGAPALQEERLAVEIALTTPGEVLALTLSPLPAEGAAEGATAPAWAVDNLIVVAERLP